MKNILIIVVNPKLTSLSFEIAKRYKAKCEKEGYQVKLLDLYRDEHQQPFYTYEGDPYKMPPTKEMHYYQKKSLMPMKLFLSFLIGGEVCPLF